jgi:glycyl-tRNA synthetase beta chain
VGSPATVRKGNEKVLKARLEDALFYWHEDLKTGLEGLAKRLDAVVFIEGLGTLKDKAERVYKLAAKVNSADDSHPPLPDATIRRATLLAKADLASEMIKDGKEFTRLQGFIGSYYAREAQESEDIILALREQYLPRFAGDDLPASRLGVLLGVADRLDTIVGCFLAGLAPTGSQDPYALRRQANGLMRILESRHSVRIDELLDQAIGAYVESGLAGRSTEDPVPGQLIEFFKTRVATFLKDNGIAYDIVGAVSAVAWAEPGVALDRARAFQDHRGDSAFELLITGGKRVGNILEPGLKVFGVGWGELEEAFLGSGALGKGIRFNPALFEDEAETRLGDAIKKTIPRLIRFEGASDGRSILNALSALGPVIDEYFDRVLVNCPDPVLRANRHHFLAAVYALFSKYADFSHIVEEGKISVVQRRERRV